MEGGREGVPDLAPAMSVAVLSMVARSKGTRMSMDSHSMRIDCASQFAIPSSADAMAPACALTATNTDSTRS